MAGLNRTATDFPRERCLPELIEEQVERAPGLPAIVAGERRLSYAEMNARANGLAAALRALPGVFDERSAVERFQGRNDARLQFPEVTENVHFRFRARWPMSLRYCMPSKRICSTAS